ncbi:major facilitator superfamily domain-containing protein [Jackrogersella minutella]|nr:major facilitator superfamily domain-containing protein [Jackrogersella minutella]
MASPVTGSFAVAATGLAPTKTTAQLTVKTGVEIKEEGAARIPSNGESGNSESNLHYHRYIVRNGQQVLVNWTKEEERRVVRKADFLFLPIFAIILYRVRPHYWIPLQVVVWGVIEILQMLVRSYSGWVAARLFLGLAESGFIPGSLYMLSRWYTQDELASRTTIFFFGVSISSAFGSLISAGALHIEGAGGLSGWQWIFLICGAFTIATGLLGFTLIPKTPHYTNRLFGGLVSWSGWFSRREADVSIARIMRADPKKEQAATMSIGLKDITDVLFN